MKKKQRITNVVLTVLLISALPSPAQVADESPAARRFQELVTDITSKLNEAKEVADQEQTQLNMERERQASTEELVEGRGEKVKRLQKARDAYQKNKNKENEEALHEALVETAGSSTDTLERLKDEVVTGSRMVDNIRNKFASVLTMMEELEQLSEDLDMADTEETRQKVKTAEDHIYNVMKITDTLANVGIEDAETKRILSTIELYAKRINSGAVRNADIQKRLTEQRKNIEHLFAQLSVVRERLEVQKTHIGQLVMGQIVDNMLLKLTHTMLAAVDVKQLPFNLMEQATQRDNYVRRIQEQNQNVYGATGSIAEEHGEYPELERIRRERENGL